MDEGGLGLPRHLLETLDRQIARPSGARCPNGAIREANRGWMKGKALQEAGAAWDVGPHKK